MPALLLSSASGTNAPLANITPVSKPADSVKTTSEPFNLLSSFGEKLSATMASVSQDKKATAAEPKLDLANLSESLNELSAQLEVLDPALFESLRSFLNGQDLSPQGLEALQAGGELPTLFAQLQTNLQLETNLEVLSDIELSALESSFAELTAFINSIASGQTTDKQQSQTDLLGFAFSIVKDGSTGDGKDNNPAQSAQVNWQKYDPQQLSQSAQNAQTQAQTLPVDQSLNSGLGKLVSETDKSFTAHIDGLNANMSSDLTDLADALLEAGQESKDKSSVSRFSDLQVKTTLADSVKPYSTTLNTPVNAKEWADEVSQKIVWFTGRNIQAAEMHLNPADLGPIDVKINVQNDVASITFNVQNASVRELLESNVVRLREMMESNGVNLGDVNVDSGKKDSYQEAQDGSQQLMAANGEPGALQDEDGLVKHVSVRSSNLVDYFV